MSGPYVFKILWKLLSQTIYQLFVVRILKFYAYVERSVAAEKVKSAVCCDDLPVYLDAFYLKYSPKMAHN